MLCVADLTKERHSERGSVDKRDGVTGSPLPGPASFAVVVDSARLRRCEVEPNRTPAPVVRKIVHLRWKQRLAPVEIADRLGMVPRAAKPRASNAPSPCCQDCGVLTFHAYIQGSHEHSIDQPFTVLPFEAAGMFVMVIEDGAGWIGDAEGDRVAVTAPQAVIWYAGDLVQYGTDDRWRTRDFWGPREQERGFYPGDPDVPAQ